MTPPSSRKRSPSTAKVASVSVKKIEDKVAELCSEAIAAKYVALSDAEVMAGITDSASLLAKVINQGGTIYACGNGGSACDAMHLCEELVAQYKRERSGIKAIHFMDPSTLTCWGNDHGFDDAYKRYAETFLTDKDLLIAISTSGNSSNVLAAAKVAQKRGTPVVVMTGKGGGKLKKMGDVVIDIPLAATERIQEAHITCIHIWCELLETLLANKSTKGR